ncbi:hypothetical protein LLEC1_03504 [Akanthomyces lecanii]|uniref:Uncharacterized protein n=1 Tax=Cordyceps confragosa TaxID=2714763 RepID=A0A179HZU3_CORDF|nr:hypothetical protein LLEC1_03504 [Akanthomyces lecanii]
MKFATAVAATLAVLAAAHPTARDPHDFVELNLPQPHNYVANDIFAGQEISKHIARAPGDWYTEEEWATYARSLCYNTPGCTTVNAYLFGPSGGLNGTGDETYWLAYPYAGPTSTINDWIHFEAPISHQRMFTSIVE